MYFLISLLISGLLAALSLGIFSSSLAWFAQNSTVGANGMAVALKSDDSVLISRIYSYKYSENNGYADFTEIDDILSPPADALKMNAFDSYIEERRIYSPMLLKVPLSRINGKNTVNIRMTCDGALNSDNKLLNNLSNVIDIRCAVSTELDALDTGDSDAFYKAAIAYFADDSEEEYTKQGFVQRDGESYSKTEVISFDVALPAPSENCVVYILLGYDAELALKYLDDNPEVESGESEENEIDFFSDLLEIKFSAKDAEG